MVFICIDLLQAESLVIIIHQDMGETMGELGLAFVKIELQLRSSKLLHPK